VVGVDGVAAGDVDDVGRVTAADVWSPAAQGTGATAPPPFF
jgi:hypothetical protein